MVHESCVRARRAGKFQTGVSPEDLVVKLVSSVVIGIPEVSFSAGRAVGDVTGCPSVIEKMRQLALLNGGSSFATVVIMAEGLQGFPSDGITWPVC